MPLPNPRKKEKKKDFVSRCISEVAKDPKFKDKLVAQGADPMPGTPEQFTAMLKTEIEKWRKIITQSKISIE